MVGNDGYWTSYKVQGGGVANYLREETMNATSTGLLSLICFTYEGNDDTDNLEIGVANYYEKIFTMELDQYEIQQYSGFSTKIIPTIKRGTVIKDNVELSWQSSDENIVTVNEDGTITLINEGEADVICTMTKNDSVTKSVHIINMGEKEEGQEEEKFYEARIYPNIHEIKQGTSQTYVIEYYINDNVASPQEITIEIDRNNVPKQNFVFTTNDNTFTITNKTKYFESPLKVHVKVDDIELNEDYWLVGAI